jgi:hypothetical protein
MAEPEIRFGPCCFCAEQIEEQGPDPCSITVETAREGEWQTWFCHAASFKARITNPSWAPDFNDPAFF